MTLNTNRIFKGKITPILFLLSWISAHLIWSWICIFILVYTQWCFLYHREKDVLLFPLTSQLVAKSCPIFFPTISTISFHYQHLNRFKAWHFLSWLLCPANEPEPSYKITALIRQFPWREIFTDTSIVFWISK